MAKTFLVYPMAQKISLKAGEVYRGSLNVAVPAAETDDFSFEISLHPYGVSGDKYDADIETVSDANQILDWIEFETKSGNLEPNDVQKINFTITVPADAPAGGQYAVIGVSSVAPEGTNESAVKDVFEMGSVIYAEIEGETVHSGEIMDNTAPSFVATGAPTTTVTLTNEGNVHETAVVTLRVKNVLTGEEIKLSEEEVNSYEAIVMPKTTREIRRGLDGLPRLGIFEIQQDVGYLGQTSNFSVVMAICPIWFMVLVAALILTILGTIFGIIHKNHKKRLKNVDF